MGINHSFDTQWCLPSKTLALSKHEIHVWRASLSLPLSRLKSLWQVLSTDEHQRAERFCFQADRDKFIATRGLLRTILSYYLGIQPGEFRFCYGPGGKPVCSDFHPDKLCFNLSHSDELALYAVAVDQELGIDLERVRAEVDYIAIARRYFTSQETTALLALPPSDHCQAFFQTWTYKEAYIKAMGGNVFQALTQVEVSLTPGMGTPLRISGPDIATNWALLPLDVAPGYVAALAVTRRKWQIKYWQWQA